MKTKKEVMEHLSMMRNRKCTKTQLNKHLQKFFGVDKTHEVEDCEYSGTDDYTYSFTFTTGESNSTKHFIDIKIDYMIYGKKGRFILITKAYLLDYVE